MTSSLEKLLAVAGVSEGPLLGDARLADESLRPLAPILGSKNGFYAFESALQVYAVDIPGDLSLERWNSPDLWRGRYSDVDEGWVFFGQDIFGEQFFLAGDVVGKFNPETGDVEQFAVNLEDWAKNILDDYEVTTGHPLEHAWQVAHGGLRRGDRLVPKIPFVAGGQYSLGNLHACESLRSMYLRADLARQIRDLPDGAQFVYKVVD